MTPVRVAWDLESRPCRENRLGLCNLLRRTGKTDFYFARPSSDQNLDRIQMLILHSQAELFLNFGDTVLLEAFAHNRGSTGYEHKTTGKFPFRDKLGVLVTGASRRGREGWL